MKKLIIVLFPFISLAQQSFYKLDSVEYYFIQLLNEYRQKTYPKIPNLVISGPYTKACIHHTTYLVNMQSADNLIQVLTHEEPNYVNGITYQGTDTLINEIAGRSAYYDVNNVFAGFSEVIQSLGVYTSDRKSVV